MRVLVTRSNGLIGPEGLQVERRWPRLPFTMRGKVPGWSWPVALYMKVPPIWRVVGIQFFVARCG